MCVMRLSSHVSGEVIVAVSTGLFSVHFVHCDDYRRCVRVSTVSRQRWLKIVLSCRCMRDALSLSRTHTQDQQSGRGCRFPDSQRTYQTVHTRHSMAQQRTLRPAHGKGAPQI